MTDTPLMHVDRARNIWFVRVAGLQYNLFPDALVTIADVLREEPNHATLGCVLVQQCRFAQSRSGKTYTVRGPRGDLPAAKDLRVEQRQVEPAHSESHASVVVQALSAVIWQEFISPRWAELERFARVMKETPAPRKNRGTESYRPVPIRHGGLI